MEQSKHYFAFISHDTCDEKTALWLRDQLEEYSIPTSVQKEVSLEYKGIKRLKPCFAYQTDLAGGDLNEALSRELNDSKFLIVICSRESAKSTYVNDEVLHFIKSGQAERIIPYIIDGEPFAQNEEDECFPLAIRELAQGMCDGEKVEAIELRGINSLKMSEDLHSKMAPVVNVIATMLGVRFDSLWNRWRYKQKRKNAIIGIAALLVVLLGIFGWDYTRSTYAYYADYVDCFGLPKGVVELNKEQVSHRSNSYQFVYRRTPFGEPGAYSWRLSKVMLVNSALRPISEKDSEWDDRFPIQELVYNEKSGLLQQINYCDAVGNVKIRHQLIERDGVAASLVDFKHSEEQLGNDFLASYQDLMMNQTGLPFQNKSTIVRYAYQRDSNGYIVKQTYHRNNDYDLSSSITCDGDGIFGKSFILDSSGRPVQIEYLGKDGERTTDKKGVAGKQYEYNDMGSIVKVTYFDLDGKPVMNDLQFAFSECVNDAYGNCSEQSFFDLDHNPCVCVFGFAKSALTFDKNGNAKSEEFFDTEGKPCMTKYGMAKYVKKVDRKGNPTETRFYDADGAPCLENQYGSAIIKVKYDSKGNVIGFYYYGVDGEPCINKEGYASFVSKYDADNNPIEEAIYGIDGKPVLDKTNGIAKRTSRFVNGLMVETCCYGIDGNPCLNKAGFSKITLAYDPRGNLIEARFFGVDNEPIVTKDGGALIKYDYDTQGNMIDCAIFDAANQPLYGSQGFARVHSVYDHGNMTEQAFYGADGKPCVCKEGVSRFVMKYDDYGNMIEDSYFDVYGNPCLTPNGYARHTAKYENGKPWMIEEACFGIDGEPCNSVQGFAWGRSKYDNKGNKLEEEYYDVNGAPCLNPFGVSKRTMKYDNRKNLVEENYFNTQGKPAPNLDGYATVRNKYDDRGNVVETTYYDAEGQPCPSIILGAAKVTLKYDNQGNRIETAYFGPNGLPCLNTDGMAIKLNQYDRFGNMIDETCLDTQGDTCLNNFGYARLTVQYDDFGNATERAFYDTFGELCISNGNFAMVRSAYDIYGHDIEDVFYGIDGNPRNNAEMGCAKVCCVFDSRDNLLERTFFDSKFEPTYSRAGYFKEVYEYDENNNCLGVSYFDVKDRPTLCSGGFSRVENEYSTNHLPVKSKYFGPNNRYLGSMAFTYNQFTFPIRRTRYDDNDNLVEEDVPVLMAIVGGGVGERGDMYILLEWEKWNITDQLNTYVGALMQARNGQKKNVLAADVNLQIERITLGSDAIIINDYIPEAVYEELCSQYELER